MAKFIIDTDLLKKDLNSMEENWRAHHLMEGLRDAHTGKELQSWLTPYKEKKKAGMNGKGPYSYLFESFWREYPARNGVKSGKRPTFKAWCKVVNEMGRPEFTEGDLLNCCLDTLEWQKRLEGWTKEKGTFIPMGSTYLGAEGWTDERPDGLKEAKVFTDMDGRVIEQ